MKLQMSLPSRAIEPKASNSFYSMTTSMECVRGLAALWVFLFHIADLIEAACPGLNRIAEHGYYGVPIFFVVSGYCIFSAAQRCIRERSASKYFLQRRLTRIFPTYWASIVVVMVLPYLMEGIASLKSGTMSWPDQAWMHYTLLDWAGVATLTKELVDHVTGTSTGYTSINAVYWTLAIEVQFYLIVYLAICFRRHWLRLLAGISTLSIVAVSMHWFAWPGFFLQFWPAFLCGIILRLAYGAGLTPQHFFGKYELPVSIVWVGTSAVLFAVLTDRNDVSFTLVAMMFSLVQWGLGGIEKCCSEGGLGSPAVRKIAASILMPFLLLGQCSYSLYLLHGKLYQFPSMFARQVFSTASPLYLLSTLLGTIFLSYCFYYVVERRYQRHAGRIGAKPLLFRQADDRTDAVAQAMDIGIAIEPDPLEGQAPSA